MKTTKTYIYKDKASLNKGLTEFLINEIFSKKGTINISLSGGNTPVSLYEYWGTYCKETINWNTIRFFWGDERCVSPDNELSNYRAAKENLFDKINIPSQHIFRIHGENDPNKEAVRYNNLLNEQLPLQNNVPSFDLVLLGLGEDGHTVSIFPEQIDLWESKENCVVTYHPDTDTQRISLTGRIINNSGCILFLVTGKNKAKCVTEILQEKEIAINKYPAAKVNAKNLYWFMDEDAASLL